MPDNVTAVLALIIFVGAYVLLATEKVHRTKVALVGAGLMLLLQISDAHLAFFSEHTGVDWNVVFLLLGMMVIVSVLRRTGIFEYVAIWAAKRSRGRPYRLMVMLCVLTAVASAVLDNVTTILLIAPVTFLVCERLGLRPAPFLIAEVMAANIGGTATLVGDPPNIIIASRGGITFNDFLLHLAPLIVALMVVFCLLCRWLFRSAFTYDPGRTAGVLKLNEREAITDPRMLVSALSVLALVVLAFVLHPVLHYEPSIVAVLGAGLLVLITGLDAGEAVADVEWPTLVFFMGLFVMVGGLVQTGAIDHLSHWLADATGGSTSTTAYGLLGGSAVLSALVDNIPYVATMSPVVASLVPGPGPHVFWWALALGADLGGNATAIGASANVVMLGIAERAGHRITFWEFTKYGLVVTVVTVALCAPYLALRYL
jgi:Na+/H+ antiporter NhaD/arsenite permease-like protein